MNSEKRCDGCFVWCWKFLNSWWKWYYFGDERKINFIKEGISLGRCKTGEKNGDFLPLLHIISSFQPPGKKSVAILFFRHQVQIELRNFNSIRIYRRLFTSQPHKRFQYSTAQWFSHKSHGPALAYEIAMSLYVNQIAWINWPYPAATAGITIFRHGLEAMIPEGQLAIGDSGYSISDRTAVLQDGEIPEVLDFKNRGG